MTFIKRDCLWLADESWSVPRAFLSTSDTPALFTAARQAQAAARTLYHIVCHFLWFDITLPLSPFSKTLLVRSLQYNIYMQIELL
jgi:hypothetical protein